MRSSFGTFNSDRPTRDLIVFPASALISADLMHRLACRKSGLPIGLPAHIQHDMHRIVGWSRTLGLYFDHEMVRSLGIFEEAETDHEKEELAARCDAFWRNHHAGGAEPYKDEIVARAAPADLENASFFRVEAAVAHRPAIAEELYPDLFKLNTKWVDKDGLVDYHYLLLQTKEIQPGIFHDLKRDLLLFAHRFLRRSLSHRNKLNSYFLQTFEASADEKNLRVRLRLDPDIIGHPKSAKLLIELEYWRGPLYSDDIESIASGVAEHKASEATRHFEGVDRTQVWWKAPETRSRGNDEATEYRTFEIEELIENPSGGLAENEFGCRYAHAEFSADDAVINHFDGAIRAYSGLAYLDRIDCSIDRAGKHAYYTKLFRFDGALNIAHWKRLLSDFFRGNVLIPEYLGAPAEFEEEKEEKQASGEERPVILSFPKLAAFVSSSFGAIDEKMQICAEHYQKVGDRIIPYAEIGTGEVARFLQSRIDLSDAMAVGISDSNLNLSRIGFGSSENVEQLFRDVVSSLSAAVRSDAAAGIIERAAVPLCWNESGLLITLTIMGDASQVADMLERIPLVLDPTKSAADWVEPLSGMIKDASAGSPAEVHWVGVEQGLLSIERSGLVQQQIILPDKLKRELVSDGVLSIEDANDLEAPTTKP